MKTSKIRLCRIILQAPEFGAKHERKIVAGLTALSVLLVADMALLIIGTLTA